MSTPFEYASSGREGACLEEPQPTATATTISGRLKRPRTGEVSLDPASVDAGGASGSTSSPSAFDALRRSGSGLPLTGHDCRASAKTRQRPTLSCFQEKATSWARMLEFIVFCEARA